MQKVRAFLCVNVSLEDLPKQYRKAIKGFSSMEPETLCLSLPETLIPPIGAKITGHDLPINYGLTVKSHEYVIISAEEIRIEVKIEPDNIAHQYPPEVLLRCFAKSGFVFFTEWDKSIKDLLAGAGLLESK